MARHVVCSSQGRIGCQTFTGFCGVTAKDRLCLTTVRQLRVANPSCEASLAASSSLHKSLSLHHTASNMADDEEYRQYTTAEVHPVDANAYPQNGLDEQQQQQHAFADPLQQQRQSAAAAAFHGHGDVHYDGAGEPVGEQNGDHFYYNDPSAIQQQQQQPQQYYEGGFSGNVPDILYLNHYCAHAFPPQDDSDEAKAAADYSWEPIRDWMRTHSADEVRAAAEQRDDAGKTALHFACQNSPPKDVIDVFLSIAAEIVQWPDSFGWLPIHYACAYGADTQVIKILAEAFPESKTTVDRKGRTPLHFALGTANSNSPAVVVLLSSTGAASYPDDNGMLVS